MPLIIWQMMSSGFLPFCCQTSDLFSVVMGSPKVEGQLAGASPNSLKDTGTPASTSQHSHNEASFFTFLISQVHSSSTLISVRVELGRQGSWLKEVGGLRVISLEVLASLLPEIWQT